MSGLRQAQAREPALRPLLPSPTARGLRAKPLQEELARRQKNGDLTWEQLARECGLSSRTILRIFATDWVTLNVADRIATALGLHGTEIWGPEWSQ